MSRGRLAPALSRQDVCACAPRFQGCVERGVLPHACLGLALQHRPRVSREAEPAHDANGRGDGSLSGSILRGNIYSNTEIPSPVSPYSCQPSDISGLVLPPASGSPSLDADRFSRHRAMLASVKRYAERTPCKGVSAAVRISWKESPLTEEADAMTKDITMPAERARG
jgi:hypothetical protein